MLGLINSITLDNLVDLAGVAGFVLSLCIAASSLWANRISISLQQCVFITSAHQKDTCFFFVCLSNQTKVPFSLVDVKIDDGTKHKPVSIQRTVFTYRSSGSNTRLPAGPVVLSQAFPVRFDSYAAEILLLPVSRQHIDIRYLHPDGLGHSQTAHLRKQFRALYKRYTHQPQPQLVLHTSRGRRAIPIYVDSVQGMDWLQKYAVQKAALEEKLTFS